MIKICLIFKNQYANKRYTYKKHVYCHYIYIYLCFIAFEVRGELLSN